MKPGQDSSLDRNSFNSVEIASNYEDWYSTVGRNADQLEKAVLKWILAKFPHASSILEVGCGTGHFTRWFCNLGLQIYGLDQSRSMLTEAKHFNGRIYIEGDAIELPFPDNSFDLVAFITTLEFLIEPKKALIEALRVARQGLVLGVINADSELGRQYKHEGGLIWEMAQLYTPGELKQTIRETAGLKAKIFWRTTIWSRWPVALPLPWGGFIGMGVKFQ